MRYFQHQTSEVREIRIFEREQAERIADPRIESRRDHHQVRTKRLRFRQQHFTERSHNFRAARARRQRTVSCRTLARARAGFVSRAGARIPWGLMRAEKEYGRILVENLLRPVPVMHIPIGNQHAFCSVLALCVSSADGNVVEQTEPHAPIAFGMMARWSNQAKRGGYGAPKNRIDRGGHTPGSTRRAVKRIFRERCIAGRKLATPCPHFASRQIDVFSPVRQRQFAVTGHPRCKPFEHVKRACKLQMIENGLDSGRLFRMTRPWIVPA